MCFPEVLVVFDYLLSLTHCSLSSVKKLLKRGQIRTVRKPGISDLEKGVAILKVAEQDPLGRFGCRLIKEKLALEGTHVSRYVIPI